MFQAQAQAQARAQAQLQVQVQARQQAAAFAQAAAFQQALQQPQEQQQFNATELVMLYSYQVRTESINSLKHEKRAEIQMKLRRLVSGY